LCWWANKIIIITSTTTTTRAPFQFQHFFFRSQRQLLNLGIFTTEIIKVFVKIWEIILQYSSFIYFVHYARQGTSVGDETEERLVFG